MAHYSADTAAPRKRHRIDVPVCWGSILGGSSDCEAVPSKMGAFREKFCAVCRKRGVLVPTTRVRVPVGPMSELANQNTEGVWNSPTTASPWPPYRVVNQTAESSGPKLVILKDECSEPLPNLVHLPLTPSLEWLTPSGQVRHNSTPPCPDAPRTDAHLPAHRSAFGSGGRSTRRCPFRGAGRSPRRRQRLSGSRMGSRSPSWSPRSRLRPPRRSPRRLPRRSPRRLLRRS